MGGSVKLGQEVRRYVGYVSVNQPIAPPVTPRSSSSSPEPSSSGTRSFAGACGLPSETTLREQVNIAKEHGAGVRVYCVPLSFCSNSTAMVPTVTIFFFSFLFVGVFYWCIVNCILEVEISQTW